MKRHLGAWIAGAAALVAAIAAVVSISNAARPQGTVRALEGRSGLAGLPAPAQSTVAAALGRDDARYRLRGLRVENPVEHFSALFTSAGPMVVSGAERVGISLASFGRAGAQRATTPVVPHAFENRVSYQRSGVREWYANGPLGLEQGFDVAQRPVAGAGPLQLSLNVAGAQPRLDHGSVLLRHAGRALRYTGLVVSDARGRILHSWLAVRPKGITIAVDDRRASYPLRVDPYIQQAELTASDGGSNDVLGYSVAISGNTIVAGAPYRTIAGKNAQGAVYVFEMPASGWANATQVAELTASDGAAGDDLGDSVAISGDTIVAGAYYHQVGANSQQGAAYVFSKPSGSDWANATQTAELTAPDGSIGAHFGSAVAASGTTVVVGATAANPSGHGAAYVFTEPGAGWSSGASASAKLTASDATGNASMGAAVAMSGNTIVVGAPDQMVAGRPSQGEAYVYVEPASGWASATEDARLIASDGGGGDGLGWSVAISGDTVVAGAIDHKVGSNSNQGAAYVFQKPTSGWVDATQNAELTASDGAASDDLGTGVGISGTTIVAGAPGHAVGGNSQQGAVYVYHEPASGWANATQDQELTASDGGANDQLGASVVVDGSTIVAGAENHNVGNGGEGAVYVFGPPPSAGGGSGGGSPGGPPSPSPGGTDSPFPVQLTSADFGVAAGLVANTPVRFSGPVAQAVSQYLWKITPQGSSHSISAACEPSQADMVTHFLRPGSYDVRLQVTQSNGPSLVADHVITVAGRPAHRFQAGAVGTVARAARHHVKIKQRMFTRVQAFDCTPAPSYAKWAAGKGIALRIPQNGSVPEGCADSVRFGIVDATGCFDEVTDEKQLPDAERSAIGAIKLTKAMVQAMKPVCPLCFARAGASRAASAAAFHDVRRAAFAAALAHSGDLYVSSSTVRINGLEYRPGVGGVIVLDPDDGWIVSSDARVVLVSGVGPDVTLADGDVSEGLPSDAFSSYHLTDFDLTHAVPLLRGFPLNGRFSADLIYWKTRMPVHLGLPNFLSNGNGGSITADVTLSTSNRTGLILDNFHIGPFSAFLGPAEIDDLQLSYTRATDSWEGSGAVRFGDVSIDARPPPPDWGFGIQHGQFKHAGAGLDVGYPGIPLWAGVNLEEIGIGIGLHPTNFEGDVKLNIFGGVAQIHGGLLAVFATPREPYTYVGNEVPGAEDVGHRTFTSMAFVAGGKVNLFRSDSLTIGHAYAMFVADPAYLELGGAANLDFGIAGVDGGIRGAFSLHSPFRWNLEGHAEIWIDPWTGRIPLVKADVLLSSNGAAGCLDGEGFGTRWGHSVHLYLFGGCDVADYRATVASAHKAQAGVTIKPGLPFAELEVTGVNDAPQLRLQGPGGQSLDIGAAGQIIAGGNVRALRAPNNNTTYISIKAPAPGTWTVTAENGSQIRQVSEADGLPDPKVTGHVKRAGGRKRVLRYTVSPRPGQVVTFVEKAAATYNMIGVAKGAHGKLKFTPSDGPAGPRQIVAQVEENGMPVSSITVASFQAPGPPHLARPHVRAHRSGAELAVSWSPVAQARQYLVEADLSDGRRQVLVVPAPRHSAQFTAIAPTTRGRVSVTARAIDNRLGRRGGVRVRAARHA